MSFDKPGAVKRLRIITEFILTVKPGSVFCKTLKNNTSFNSYLIIDKLPWTSYLTCEMERVWCWRYARCLGIKTYRAICVMIYLLVQKTWPEHGWSLFSFADPHVNLIEITSLWRLSSEMEQPCLVRLWEITSCWNVIYVQWHNFIFLLVLFIHIFADDISLFSSGVCSIVSSIKTEGPFIFQQKNLKIPNSLIFVASKSIDPALNL